MATANSTDLHDLKTGNDVITPNVVPNVPEMQLSDDGNSELWTSHNSDNHTSTPAISAPTSGSPVHHHQVATPPCDRLQRLRA